jgi:hypothetical protein
VLSNAVDPGWVKTRLGGRGAPGRVEEGADTPVWLATSTEPDAMVSGGYFYRQDGQRANPLAYKEDLQDGLLDACRALSEVAFP